MKNSVSRTAPTQPPPPLPAIRFSRSECGGGPPMYAAHRYPLLRFRTQNSKLSMFYDTAKVKGDERIYIFSGRPPPRFLRRQLFRTAGNLCMLCFAAPPPPLLSLQFFCPVSKRRGQTKKKRGKQISVLSWSRTLYSLTTARFILAYLPLQ